jgi:serine/threonine-protein kinase
MLSPDGKWLAFQSNESGSPEIYVRRFPDVHGGGRWQVSTGGGRWPLWAPNGRELFFVETAPGGVSGRMMTVPVTPGTTFTAGIPRALFEVRSFPPYASRSFDVSADGARFLMLTTAPEGQPDEAPPAQVVVVLNWIEELKRMAEGPGR